VEIKLDEKRGKKEGSAMRRRKLERARLPPSFLLIGLLLLLIQGPLCR